MSREIVPVVMSVPAVHHSDAILSPAVKISGVPQMFHQLFAKSVFSP